MIRSLVLATALLAAPAAFAQDAQPAPSTPGGRGGYGQTASPEMREARRKMTEACSADVQTFCPDAPAGGGGRMQCLREHAADLSDGCKAAMQSMRALRQGAGPASPAPPPPAPTSPQG